MRKSSRIVLISLAVLLAIATLAAGVMFYLWKNNEFTLALTLNDSEEIIIEYGGFYQDPGASATLQGTTFIQEPIAVDVTTQGSADLSKVGTYQINYSARYVVESIMGDVTLEQTAQRIIRVVDTVSPVITLVSDPDVFTIPGETYLEEGFKASDNYDGDLTDQVIRTETAEAITYLVADSSGNEATIERPIVYHDPIAPELKLKGKASISLKLGSRYQEPGYTATDNCDGDITDLVIVSGNVNTKKAGTYKLKYTVEDSYKNTATAIRTVTVYEPEPEPQVSTKPTESKSTEPKPTEPKPQNQKVDPQNPVGGVIYLTFDDGPSKYTPRLLKILAKYNVKASFFVVNTQYISTVADIAAGGHTVAIHSNTHNFKEIYSSEDVFFADLTAIQSAIAKYSGITSTLMRFPGGSSNTASRFNEGIMTRLTALVEEKGYTYFDWNVDSDDAGGATTSQKVYNNVVSAVAKRKSSVVLLHDTKSYTVDAIEDLIIWGQKNGYTFKALNASSPTCHHTVKN